MKKLLLTLAISLLCAASASAEEFKVIVNNSVKLDLLSKKDASAIFLKKTAKWGNGTPVVPVDQIESAVRDAFSKTVHGKATAAVKSYWNQQIFSGRDVPPLEKPSNSEVLAFVRSTPGAIGYVSADTPTDGVRTVAIN